jgi:hypothetical protein
MPSSGGTRVMDNTGQEGSDLLLPLCLGEGLDGPIDGYRHRRRQYRWDSFIFHVGLLRYSGEPLREASPPTAMPVVTGMGL